jgi:hypothetical protein
MLHEEHYWQLRGKLTEWACGAAYYGKFWEAEHGHPSRKMEIK